MSSTRKHVVKKPSYLFTPNGSYLAKAKDRDEANDKAAAYARNGITVEIYEKLTIWTPDRVKQMDKIMKGVDA